MKEQGKKERCYVGKGRNRGELRENERTGDKERGEDVMREWGDRGQGKNGTGGSLNREMRKGERENGKKGEGTKDKGQRGKGERTDYILLLSVICELNSQHL